MPRGRVGPLHAGAVYLDLAYLVELGGLGSRIGNGYPFAPDFDPHLELVLRLSAFADGDGELAVIITDVAVEGEDEAEVGVRPLIEGSEEADAGLH